ncbi:MAG: hypothetical protein HY702_01395 [Gemmatimonadetes bacterium]|nr:hypothetical protein [Gemmatimonadota bacterium]
MRLGIDIDGVVLDFVTAFCTTCRERYGYAIRYEDIVCHDLGQVLGVGSKTLERLIEETLESELIKPYSGAVEGLRRLRQQGHVVELLTSRPQTLRKRTEAVLRQYNVAYDKIIFALFLQKVAKVEALDLFIEDSLAEALEVVGNGTPVLIYKHPWNERSLNVEGRLQYVETWEQLVAAVEQIAAERLTATRQAT